MNRVSVTLVTAALVAVTMLACDDPHAGRHQAPPQAPPQVPALAHCQGESGPGADQAYPCQWDCRVDGNHLCGTGPHVTVYQNTPCPAVDQGDVLCVQETFVRVNPPREGD